MAAVQTGNSVYIVLVDGVQYGYTTNYKSANETLVTIANELASELKTKYPDGSVEYVKSDDKLKIKCIQTGYIYNSKWTAHTLHFTPVKCLKTTPFDQKNKYKNKNNKSQKL